MLAATVNLVAGTVSIEVEETHSTNITWMLVSIAAFDKARVALAVKRANDKEFKAANKKPIGRPKKVAAAAAVKEEPKPRRRVA